MTFGFHQFIDQMHEPLNNLKFCIEDGTEPPPLRRRRWHAVIRAVDAIENEFFGWEKKSEYTYRTSFFWMQKVDAALGQQHADVNNASDGASNVRDDLRFSLGLFRQSWLDLVGSGGTAHTFSGREVSDDLKEDIKTLMDNFCTVCKLQQFIRPQTLTDTGKAFIAPSPAAHVEGKPTTCAPTRQAMALTATRVAATIAAGIGGFGLVSATLMSASYFCISWAIAPFVFYTAPVVGLAVGASCARVVGGATPGASAAAHPYLTRLAAAEQALWSASVGALAWGIVGAAGCALWRVALLRRSYVALYGAIAGTCLGATWETYRSVRGPAVNVTTATT